MRMSPRKELARNSIYFDGSIAATASTPNSLPAGSRFLTEVNVFVQGVVNSVGH